MPEKAEMPENVISEKYVIFSVFDRKYAFPMKVIGEVAKCEHLYPLPLLPSYVLGVIDRYSVPYALFDISFLLTNKTGPRNEALVINKDIDQVAFSIEIIAGITDIAQDKLKKVETGLGPLDFHSAVYASFEWKGEDVFALDVRELLARITQEAAQ
jgi:chemotaxis signal transduction protein